MKRRSFLAAAGLAGLASTSPMALAAAEGGAKKQYYDLRLIQVESKTKQAALIKFLGNALIPALNRIGVRPVGVFTLAEEESSNLYVLAPHNTLESVATWVQKLGEDEAFLQAGAEVLDAPFKDPAYARMESSLLVAFDKMPRLAVPSTKATRVFQLRTYENPTMQANQRKVEMFNTGGEIDVFLHCGMTPVFFGNALVGGKLPNVTYMLGFDDRETGDKAWKAFIAAPGWAKLKDDPYYKDTVSHITNIWLNPAPCSQI